MRPLHNLYLLAFVLITAPIILPILFALNVIKTIIQAVKLLVKLFIAPCVKQKENNLKGSARKFGECLLGIFASALLIILLPLLVIGLLINTIISLFRGPTAVEKAMEEGNFSGAVFAAYEQICPMSTTYDEIQEHLKSREWQEFINSDKMKEELGDITITKEEIDSYLKEIAPYIETKGPLTRLRSAIVNRVASSMFPGDNKKGEFGCAYEEEVSLL